MEVHQKSIVDIEGVGPAYARKLNKMGIHCLGDLVCIPLSEDQLQSIEGVSKASILGWRSMANLMMVRGVDGQCAEGFYRGGVENLEMLSRLKLTEARDLLKKAKRSRIIPNVPDIDSIAGMLVDAAILSNTARVFGVIRDKQGKPVPSVTVSVKNNNTKSDRRGRYVLHRVPLRTSAPLVMRKKGFVTAYESNLDINDGTKVFSARSHVLTRTNRKTEPVLSELEGDSLPDVSGFPIRTRRKKSADLRENDLLFLREIDVTKNTGELVSMYREFQDGTVFVKVYRIKLKNLPGEAKLKSYWLFRQGRLISAPVTPRSVERFRMIRRFEKANPNFKPPKTIKQFESFSKKLSRFQKKERKQQEKN